LARGRQCESDEYKSQGFSARMRKIVLKDASLPLRQYKVNEYQSKAISAGSRAINAERASLF